MHAVKRAVDAVDVVKKHQLLQDVLAAGEQTAVDGQRPVNKDVRNSLAELGQGQVLVVQVRDVLRIRDFLGFEMLGNLFSNPSGKSNDVQRPAEGRHPHELVQQPWNLPFLEVGVVDFLVVVTHNQLDGS